MFLVAAILTVVVAPVASAKGPKDIYSIVDLVIANPDINNDGEGDFDILLAAVQNADPSIAEKLNGKGQYTVFAPTDDAFVALLGELGLTAEQVLSNTDLLSEVLLYHVANGRRDSTQVLESERIRTLQGGFLYQMNGTLTDMNGRESIISVVDLEVDNGIVHVIDTVVLP